MSRPVKRSFSLNGHHTSLSMEKPFWDALKEAADARALSLAALVSLIDERRDPDNGLSSAVRVWILDYYRSRSPRSNDR